MNKSKADKKIKIIAIVLVSVIDALLLAALLSFLITKSVRNLGKTETALYTNRIDRFELDKMNDIDECFDKYNYALNRQYSKEALIKCAKAIVAERENNIYAVSGCVYDASAGQCIVSMKQILGGGKLRIVLDILTCGLIEYEYGLN